MYRITQKIKLFLIGWIKKVLHMQYYISQDICLTCKTNFPTLSLMKQLITIFLLVLPISAYAENVLNYKPNIEKCDEQFEYVNGRRNDCGDRFTGCLL